jgi:putative transposase
MVKNLSQWPWSSYPATMGIACAAEWLDTDWLLSQFGKQHKLARRGYHEFILQGKGLASPLEEARYQFILGDDAFVEQFRNSKSTDQLREISKAQKRSQAKTLYEYDTQYKTRNEGMAKAYHSGAYTMREIAEYFAVHYMTVSRAVRQYEN